MKTKLSPGLLHLLSLLASSVTAFLLSVLLIYVSCRIYFG